MNFARFGIILLAHVVAVGIVYLLSNVGGKDTGAATAGANGLVNWSSQAANASDPVVAANGALSFNPAAKDLSGYNSDMIVADASQPRFEPTRPTGEDSTASSAIDDDVLTPLNPYASTDPVPTFNPPPTEPSKLIEYTVSSGDSLWSISKKFGVSIAELKATNPTLTANIRPGQTLGIPRYSAEKGPPEVNLEAPNTVGDRYTYVVKKGDSLGAIAARQGVTVAELRSANGIQGSMIKPGQALKIPRSGSDQPSSSASRGPRTGRRVVVEPGDTLSTIARTNGTTTADLIEFNDIDDPRRIRIGQTIFIPSGTSNQGSTAQSASRNPQPAPSRDEQPENQPPPMEPLPEDTSPPPTLDDEPILFDEDLENQPVIPIEE